MYVPKPFAFPEGAVCELHDLIEERIFGIMAAPGDGSSDPASGLQAVHMPWVLDRAVGRDGVGAVLDVAVGEDGDVVGLEQGAIAQRRRRGALDDALVGDVGVGPLVHPHESRATGPGSRD